MGCFGLLKLLMFIFNSLIFVAGAALLGVGIWVKVDSGSILGLLQKIEGAPEGLGQLLNVGYLLVAVGGLLVVIGFLGCCGAVRESQCMLLLFFIIILVIFLVEVAGAVVILVFKPVVKELVEKLGGAATTNIRKDYGNNKDITGLWDTTMETLSCCGFNNYSDFTGSPYYSNHNSSYPQLCCFPVAIPCVESVAMDSSNTKVTGCYTKIGNLLNENSIVIIAVALGIAMLEILAMIVAMSLYCQIGSKRSGLVH